MLLMLVLSLFHSLVPEYDNWFLQILLFTLGKKYAEVLHNLVL